MPKKLKQRMVGLLVLGALTAIIVPILLDISQSNQSGMVVTPIPEKPNGFVVKRLSLDAPLKPVILDDIPESTEPIDTISNNNSTQTDENKKQREVLPVEVHPEPEPETSRVVTEVKKNLKNPQAWVIQLASFSREKNALALRNQLKKSGYRAFIERIDVATNKKFRVKVGPELSKETAKNMQSDLMDEFQLKGVVVKHRTGTSVVTTGE